MKTSEFIYVQIVLMDKNKYKRWWTWNMFDRRQGYE